MKTGLLFVLQLTCLNFFGLAQGFVTLRGRVFHDEQDNKYFPLVMNYGAMIYTNQSNPGVLKLGRDRSYGTIGCPTYEGGYTWADIEMSLIDDFHQIRSMGFNAIRLNMQPTFEPDGVNRFFYETFDFPNVCDTSLDQEVRFPASCGNEPAANAYFQLVERAIDYAASEGLKVILLCVGNRPLRGQNYAEQMGSNDAYTSDYATYLGVLAYRLKSKTNLISYELLPEPHWASDSRRLVRTKSDVCRYVNQWVSAIKAVDSHHLVNMEGTSIFDVFDWDGAVMNVDFLAMHPYPFLVPTETTDRARIAADRVTDQIAWMSKNLNKPFIIGETGFSAPPDVDLCLVPPYVDGTEEDEKNFVEKVLNASRDLGASGFSYWEFMDKHWHSVPNFLCSSCFNCGGVHIPTPSSPAAEYYDIRENYYGLLRYANPIPAPSHPWSYDPQDESKAIACFRSFKPFLFSEPEPETEYYHNPYQLEADYSEISGTVLTNNSAPFEDAVAKFSTSINWASPGGNIIKLTYENYDFSNQANGQYDIRYWNSTGSLNLKVVVAGSGTDVHSFVRGTVDPLILEQAQWNQRLDVASLAVTHPFNLNGFAEYIFRDVFFFSAAESEIVARDLIELNAEVEIALGAEVLLRVEDQIQSCPDYSGFATSRISSGINSSSIAKELTVFFDRARQSVNVFPNPTFGNVRLLISESDVTQYDNNDYRISVLNNMGISVLTMEKY